MPTKRLKQNEKNLLSRLGRRVEKMIILERGFKSLDAFALEFQDDVTKATLYSVCDGTRDMKFSTALGLSRALRVTLSDLFKDL